MDTIWLIKKNVWSVNKQKEQDIIHGHICMEVYGLMVVNWAASSWIKDYKPNYSMFDYSLSDFVSCTPLLLTASYTKKEKTTILFLICTAPPWLTSLSSSPMLHHPKKKKREKTLKRKRRERTRLCWFRKPFSKYSVSVLVLEYISCFGKFILKYI